jgi:hypothetical protein
MAAVRVRTWRMATIQQLVVLTNGTANGCRHIGDRTAADGVPMAGGVSLLTGFGVPAAAPSIILTCWVSGRSEITPPAKNASAPKIAHTLANPSNNIRLNHAHLRCGESCPFTKSNSSKRSEAPKNRHYPVPLTTPGRTRSIEAVSSWPSVQKNQPSLTFGLRPARGRPSDRQKLDQVEVRKHREPPPRARNRRPQSAKWSCCCASSIVDSSTLGDETGATQGQRLEYQARGPRQARWRVFSPNLSQSSSK